MALVTNFSAMDMNTMLKASVDGLQWDCLNSYGGSRYQKKQIKM